MMKDFPAVVAFARPLSHAEYLVNVHAMTVMKEAVEKAGGEARYANTTPQEVVVATDFSRLPIAVRFRAMAECWSKRQIIAALRAALGDK